MFQRVLGAVALTLVLSAGSVAAASLHLHGGKDFTLRSNYSLNDKTGPILESGDVVKRNAKLFLTGNARVTFSYVGSESGYRNVFKAGGDKFRNWRGENAPFSLDLSEGRVKFKFKTRTGDGVHKVRNGKSRGRYNSIALFQMEDAPNSVFALLNDKSRSDKDYDDMVVRMDVAPVPLPAAAFLLIAGIGGLGLASRKRKKA